MKKLLAILCMCISVNAFTQCATSGPNNPSTTANSSAVGTLGWSNVTNILTSNNSYAGAGALLGILATVNTNYVVATNFGFSLPASASICGIKLDAEKTAVGIVVGASITDNSVRLVKAGSVTGNNAATATDWLVADTYESYGSNSDLWGTTWTASQINNTGFGVAISARLATGLASLFLTAQIDHIRITVYYNITVPLTLENFNVTPVNDAVSLQWRTASETNTDKFLVERSVDNNTWDQIGTVQAAGTSNLPLTYKYIDEQPDALNYYRLKMLDQNGHFEYSKTLLVQLSPDNNPLLRLGAIPSNSMLTIHSKEPIRKMQVFDSRGWLMSTISSPGKDINLDVSKFQNGIYFLRFNLREKIVVKRFVVAN